MADRCHATSPSGAQCTGDEGHADCHFDAQRGTSWSEPRVPFCGAREKHFRCELAAGHEGSHRANFGRLEEWHWPNEPSDSKGPCSCDESLSLRRRVAALEAGYREEMAEEIERLERAEKRVAELESQLTEAAQTIAKLLSEKVQSDMRFYRVARELDEEGYINASLKLREVLDG